MKSDEKVIEAIGKISDEFFHLIPSDFQYKGFDRKGLYNWFKSAFEYTALKTRREAVEERDAEWAFMDSHDRNDKAYIIKMLAQSEDNQP